jgi:hypothetical protein
MAKKHTLTERQEQFLDALFDDRSDGSVAEASRIAGIDPSYGRRLAYSLADEIQERARKYLGASTAHMARILTKEAAAPSLQSRDRVAAAAQALDRTSVSKTQHQAVTLTQSVPGIVSFPGGLNDVQLRAWVAENAPEGHAGLVLLPQKEADQEIAP